MSDERKPRTLGQELAWRQELLDGKRPGTVEDVPWLVLDLSVMRDRYVYYLKKSRGW